MINDTERTILQAAANLLRDAGVEAAKTASDRVARDYVTAALRASVDIEAFFSALEDMERPF